MTAAASIKNVLMIGIRSGFRHKTAAVWTYVAVLTASLPFALAAGWLVNDKLGKSLSAVDFAKRLDPILMMELVRDRRAALMVLLPAFFGALVLWTLISTFAYGAILSVVSRADPSRTSDFFSAGGRVFGRLLRLLLFGLPFMLLATGLASWILYKGTGSLTHDWVSEKGVFAARVIATLVGLLVLAWTGGAYDLMRVEAVARGEHRARYAFVRGLARAVRHPIAVLSVEIPFGLATIALTLVASLADVHISRDSWAAIIVGLALEQTVAALRALVKISLAGSEVAYVMLSGR